MLLFTRHCSQPLVTQYISSESLYIENHTCACACTQKITFKTNSRVASTVVFLIYPVSRKPFPIHAYSVPASCCVDGHRTFLCSDVPLLSLSPSPALGVFQAGVLIDLPSEQTLAPHVGRYLQENSRNGGRWARAQAVLIL